MLQQHASLAGLEALLVEPAHGLSQIALAAHIRTHCRQYRHMHSENTVNCSEGQFNGYPKSSHARDLWEVPCGLDTQTLGIEAPCGSLFQPLHSP